MKRLLLILTLMLGMGVNAQSFDFSPCDNGECVIENVNYSQEYLPGERISVRIDAFDPDEGDELAFVVHSLTDHQESYELMLDNPFAQTAFWILEDGLPEGEYSYNIGVSDGQFTASASITLFVVAPPEPVLDNEDPSFWNLSSEYSFIGSSSSGAYISFAHEDWKNSHIEVRASTGKWIGKKNDGGIVSKKGYSHLPEGITYQEQLGYSDWRIAASFAQWHEDLLN